MSHALTAMGVMDPERLHARVNKLEVEEERSEVSRIVEGGLACLTRIQSINFSALEQATGRKDSRELWDDASPAVSALWMAVEDLNGILDPLIQAHEEKQSGSDDDLEFDFGEAEEVAAPTVASTPLTPLERIGETAWATCFVLNGELQSFRKRLPNLLKVEDTWELLSDLQDHVGHVRAAVNAILTGVYSSLPSSLDEGDEQEENLELMASLELRVRVFELRDQVVRIEKMMTKTPPHEWEKYLRLSCQMIETFMFGPGFAWMRASDKRTFITQHRALAEILELWSPLRAMPAKNIVSNMARYLEALEVINQREMLVEHDRTKLEVVVSKLGESKRATEPSEQRAALAGALAALAELQGRDSALDVLIDKTLDPSAPVPVSEIYELASQLLAKLSGS
ncbi:MAG: hypothetical protein AAF658_09940 [Myxococcota bacterium]